MKFFFLAVFLILTNTCISQIRWEGAAFMQDGNGNWIDPKPPYKTEGSPFYNENYFPARLTVGNKTYLVQAKLNLADNTVHFDNEGKEMVSSKPVNKVEFINVDLEKYLAVFKSGFPSLGKNTEQSYYQVLDSGKATLLKHISIRRRETVPYNSATRLTVYDKDHSYYVFLNNKMSLIKNVSDLVEATNDRKEKIKPFIKSNKIRANKEEDLISTITFYNSL